MTNQTDEVAQVKRSASEADARERVAVVPKRFSGSRQRAIQILAKGAPYGLGLAGFR